MGSKKKAKKAAPVVTFQDVAGSFMRTVHALVLGLKGRTGGAQDYGADGLFVCAVESLHTARGSRNLESFLKSAAYAVAAAMKACGAWEYPIASPKKDDEKKPKKKPKKKGEKVKAE